MRGSLDGCKFWLRGIGLVFAANRSDVVRIWVIEETGGEGFFCCSTSYRHEPNPVARRHDLIFPLFEFEMHDGMEDLIKMEKDLLLSLGYNKEKFIRGIYLDVAKHYNTKEVEHVHEQALADEFSESYFLTNFPDFGKLFPFFG